MNQPEIAVVIPTRNVEPRLAFTLDALAEQSLGSECFEVIVVRGSGDSGLDPPSPAGLRMRLLVAEGASGPAAKRNAGWRACGAAIVAFTDDDCRPAPDWLERLLAAARPGAIVQGRTVADPDERHLRYGLVRTRQIDGPSDWFEACNIAYPRELLERLDGFCEDYDFGGEDTDLGLRARASGAPLAYVDDAVVRHAILTPSVPRAMRAELERHSQALLFARHPGQRRAILAGVFLRPHHARLLFALAGALLFRRRPLFALGATLPYLQIEWRLMTPRRALRTLVSLPSRLAVDLAEVAGTVRGAIRHRVFLL